MTTPIHTVLAKEFSIREEQVSRTLELLGEGYRVPYLAHFRRAEIGGLTEGPLRRLERRRRELEELEKRRGTLLTQLVKQAGLETDDPERWKDVRAVTDAHELEDFFLHHRSPEPEVQLAQDRGLEGMADVLTTLAAKPKPGTESEAAAETGEAAGEAAGEAEGAPRRRHRTPRSRRPRPNRPLRRRLRPPSRPAKRRLPVTRKPRRLPRRSRPR